MQLSKLQFRTLHFSAVLMRSVSLTETLLDSGGMRLPNSLHFTKKNLILYRFRHEIIGCVKALERKFIFSCSPL